jgi:hypothetical protein
MGIPRATPATQANPTGARRGKPIGGSPDLCGLEQRAGLRVTLTMAAYDLVHLPQLLPPDRRPAVHLQSRQQYPHTPQASIPPHPRIGWPSPANLRGQVGLIIRYPARRNWSMASGHQPIIPAPKPWMHVGKVLIRNSGGGKIPRSSQLARAGFAKTPMGACHTCCSAS